MFTRSQAEEMLDEVLRMRSELDYAECKTGAGDALKRAVCAASNRRDRNGGVIFVGVHPDYRIEGVSGIEKMQEDITSWSAGAFNTPLRVAIEVFEREGKNLLAVIVPPCPAGSRPCCFKNKGPYENSWIRANNSTCLMTQDEVRREIAGDEIARGTVAPFDRLPYLQASLEAFDESLIQTYIALIKRNRPNSQIENVPKEKKLYDVKAITLHEGTYYPTPTGLMFFCREPHRYLPQITVEFLHLWGPEFTRLGPDGSRWRVNQEVFGTLPQIIDKMENLLLERIPTRGFIDTFRRRDEPEPALRSTGGGGQRSGA